MATLRELAEGLVGTRERPRDGVTPEVRDEVLDAVADEAQSVTFLSSAQESRDRLDLARHAAERERERPELAGWGLAGTLAAFLRLAGSSSGLAPGIVAALATALGGCVARRLWLRRRNWRRAAAAEQRWRDVLLLKVLEPYFIQRKNGRLADRLGLTVAGAGIRPTDYGHDPEYAVTSAAMRKVSDASRTITAGSIGISGPRGAGKSTILNKLDTRIDRGKPEQDIRVYVSAPVDYDAREFIIHLFTELCVKVLAEAPALSPMAAQTRRQLSTLRFLSTYSSSWALGLAGAPGSLAWTPSKQKAEQPAGLPAIVEQFRAYSGQAAEWARTPRDQSRGESGQSDGRVSDGRVIICIDEMDKIRDSDRAEQFLNSIKAIFDVPGCLYLVSISEDAMAVFASQTPAIKTAFDSAFDEIISVGPMTFEEAGKLLDLRVTGVPLPFLALCHVLAGGVPRELIRAARSLYQAAREAAQVDLAEMTKRLVKDRCEVMRQEAILQLGRSGAPPGILQPLYQQGWPGTELGGLAPGELTKAADALTRAAAGLASDEWRRMCLDVEVALLFYATVIELFAEHGDDVVTALTATSGQRIDGLATVRHAMRMNSEVARALLADWRGEPPQESSGAGN
jgi:hypothetical protein